MHNVIIVLGLISLLVVWPSWRIACKAGYNGWYSLLMIISPINIVLLFVFAFSEWPLERRARANK